jgi:hypothetical protein
MKKYIILVLIVLLIGALTVGVLAGKTGQAGKSNIAHLYLYEKTSLPLTDPPTPWPIVEDGAWGKMKYNLSGSTFDFVFNGHGLEAGEDYTLIYYPDPWPGTDLICLGDGTANVDGDVHIAGSVDTGDLPTGADTIPLGGAKIWLVLSDDITCDDQFYGWNPTEYLFEGDVITFDDTDVP